MNLNNYGRNLTQAQKLVAVNDAMGNPSAASQQGSSRQMYDTLPLDGNQNLQFFQNCASRQYPFTNIPQNRLTLGESMTVQRLYFAVVTFDAVTAQPLTVETFAGATLDPFYMSDYSVYFDTVQQIKATSLSSQLSAFNKFASFDGNEVITCDNNIVLPQDLQFRVTLNTPEYTPVANTYIRCVLEGFGTIYSPKNQF